MGNFHGKILASSVVLSYIFISNISVSTVWGNEPAVEPNQQYFQNIASHWLPTKNNTGTSPAVLKGHIDTTYSTYIIGPGDTLTITIPDMFLGMDDKVFSPQDPNATTTKTPVESLDILVRENGEITIPPFGVFNVAGMSLSQLTGMVEDMSKFFLVNPRVFITLKNARPFTVYMLGQVQRPGAYQVISQSEQSASPFVRTTDPSVTAQQIYEPRLSTLVAKSRGVLDYADAEHVHITNEQTNKDITVSLQKMLHGDVSQDVLLEPNDVVMIPKSADDKLVAEEVSTSSMGRDLFIVRVFGYVARSATNGSTDVVLEPRYNTALNALSKLDVDPDANLKHLVVLRRDPKTSKFQRFDFNGLAQDFRLQPNDVVIVPHRKGSNIVEQMVLSAEELFIGASNAHVIRGLF